MLLPEDTFPNFFAKSTIGEINLYDFLGGCWCLFFSQPADFTPVCTTELAEAARYFHEFKRRNVKLVALSCSSLGNHFEWLEDVKAYAGIDKSADFPFPIIDDSDRVLSIKLSMIRAQDIDNNNNVPNTVRHCFILSPDKKIKFIAVYPDSTGRNFLELLRVVDSLQLAAKWQLCTPADWQQGDKCLVLPMVDQEQVDILFPKGIDTFLVPSGKHYLRVTDMED